MKVVTNVIILFILRIRLIDDPEATQEIKMTDDIGSAIQLTIANLRVRTPRLRGRRAQLLPYVDDLRKLIAQGWTRAEIVDEVKVMGAKISPALLRDVLQIPTVPMKQKPKIKHKTYITSHPEVTLSLVATTEAKPVEPAQSGETVEAVEGLEPTELAWHA